ncbi:hypothetical protein B0J12DRAFT_732186 [Macrophomina phaseolina]|uniref:Uncharacterized protein n=1 Tax=Macrophomina phaseolina TaxID=35725 RepID=A0ABQ8FWN2_9PEZI|nr:hypothetical protein B0J12DRAFT_732186 [Macrophomina phaseolina]
MTTTSMDKVFFVVLQFLFLFGLGRASPTADIAGYGDSAPNELAIRNELQVKERSRSHGPLRKRNAQQDGVCTVIFSCPSSGQDAIVFEFSSELTAPDPTGGGRLRSAADLMQAVIVTNPPEKDISVFPATVGEDWTVSKCKQVEGERVRCLLTWTFSVSARMDNPNSLVLSDLNTHGVSEICVPAQENQCSTERSRLRRCQIRQGTGCDLG